MSESEKLDKIQKFVNEQMNCVEQQLNMIYPCLPENQEEYDIKLECWGYLKTISVEINKIMSN